MKILYFPLLCLFLCAQSAIGQKKKDNFGTLNIEERNFTSYEKDPSASAVVLYEKGDNYFEVIDRWVRVVKDYHVKIKILDEKGFDEGTVSIWLRKGENSKEKLKNLRAVTHNGTVKTSVMQNQVFHKDVNQYWMEKTFSFPNIKKGSVLEYQYKIISPFIYHFNGWDFQSHIPKLYSEFNARIPGNYIYNRTLVGTLKLSKDDASLKKDCFQVEGYPNAADCEVLQYAMEDIPAFKEEEFMLAASNYKSRLDFELSVHHRFDGVTDRYTKSWKDVDKEFRLDKNIGRQLTKKGFFEKQVPESLLTEGDELSRAQNIYKFVRDHYTWNGKYGIYRDIRVKEAFEDRKGNVGEINITLINLLNSAGIPTNLMLTSTRKHGMPKKIHPVMSDFNYVLAKTVIDGKDYFLDATDKFNPFGMLPYRCLNYYGRVMDFKNDSYWADIPVAEKSRYIVRAQVKLDPADDKVSGIFDVVTFGYDAINRRKNISEQDEDAFLGEMEDEVGNGFEITSYKLIPERTDEKMVSERFEYEITGLAGEEKIYLDPFLIKFFDSDPFITEERHFPIDFGYARNYNYSLNIILPDGYEAAELPEPKVVKLPNNLGLLKFDTGVKGNNLNIYYNLVIKSPHFTSDYYQALKEIFSYALDIQNNSLIVLKKNS
ncbi:DUF3857 domain-containing protein [Poritiphilus flavus]|uniref:DUF3857 domain-containing protein n=1 Tax=Poritiphilus flavus TaxID=2697053 RepID=A0A6L9E8M1_9FLAO|nr:DUF3857 domain-containing protein [Poritiphilus flavus]NAS11060.1 DUF3857 domain-containing protein [Poritiphilus flavus]